MGKGDMESGGGEPLPCDLCGGADAEELSGIGRDGAPLRTVICRDCGLVYTDPRPAPEEVRAYYEHGYRLDYKGAWQPKPKHIHRAGRVAAERLSRLAPFLVPGGRVLDFGAGGGEMVHLLRSRGWDASGFEPNEGYARFAAEELGLPVVHAFYQDVAVASGSLDAVTCFHVLEHLESPCDALRHVHRWLRPGGLLLAEVPNVEAVCQWPRSRFHRAHLYNFNPATLARAGAVAGFAAAHVTASADGGNVAAVFQKEPVSGRLPGNGERVRRIVRGHTAARHLLSRHPWLRPVRRWAAALAERRAVRGGPSPREILDRCALG